MIVCEMSKYIEVQKDCLSKKDLNNRLHSYIDGKLFTELYEYDFYTGLYEALKKGNKTSNIYHDLISKNNANKTTVDENIISLKISCISNLSKEKALELLTKQTNQPEFMKVS